MITYVDTSVLVAIAFGERGSDALHQKLLSCEAVVSSPLLEAELRSTFAREAREFDDTLLADLNWILPRRSLGGEIARVLSSGYVRGADCWHLATALYVDPTASRIAFTTLDAQQAKVAKRLGFLRLS